MSSTARDNDLKLPDGTGCRIHKNKKVQIPETCTPILERLEYSPETWLNFVQNFRLRFRYKAGLATSRQAYRDRPRPNSSAQQAT